MKFVDDVDDDVLSLIESTVTISLATLSLYMRCKNTEALAN